jgi:hypothetical protein
MSFSDFEAPLSQDPPDALDSFFFAAFPARTFSEDPAPTGTSRSTASAIRKMELDFHAISGNEFVSRILQINVICNYNVRAPRRLC